MFCEKCGSSVEQNDTFCISCGRQINEGSQGTEAEVNNTTHTQVPTINKEELYKMYKMYGRRMWLSLLGPIGGIFLIVLLWGLISLAEEIGGNETIISTVGNVFGLLIPILLALFMLCIPIGIILGIIQSQERSKIRYILLQNNK